jgi:hypothetical protein
MRIQELLAEKRSHPDLNIKAPVSQQIQAIIAKHGGTADDYWIHNSAVDHLGFYGGDKNAVGQGTYGGAATPMKAPVVPGKAFSKQLQYTAAERGGVAPKGGEKKHGLWFSPLKPNLKGIDRGFLPFPNKFTFLVKLNDDAWLQPINLLQKARANLIGIKPPAGKKKVGQYNPSTKIAVLFDPAFEIVGKWTEDEISNAGGRTRFTPDQKKQTGLAASKEKTDKKAALDKELDDLF